MSTAGHPLRVIQEWMKAVMTHPGGIHAGLASDDASRTLAVSADQLHQVILPSSQMTSHDRLQIYQRAYFSRLVECMRALFPSVHRSLGDESFDAIAFGYLVETPSRSHTLATLGDSFPQFLAATRPPLDDAEILDYADFLIELAELEQVYGAVFHGSGPEVEESLSADDLAGLSPGQFAQCRLVPHASIQLRTFRFPVHEYATAVRNGAEANVPEPREVHLVICRREYVVRRFEITPTQYSLLSSIVADKSVGDSLRTLWNSAPAERNELASQVRTWFRDWAELRLFKKVQSQGI